MSFVKNIAVLAAALIVSSQAMAVGHIDCVTPKGTYRFLIASVRQVTSFSVGFTPNGASERQPVGLFKLVDEQRELAQPIFKDESTGITYVGNREFDSYDFGDGVGHIIPSEFQLLKDGAVIADVTCK
jgi:hypothetical protein